MKKWPPIHSQWRKRTQIVNPHNVEQSIASGHHHYSLVPRCHSCTLPTKTTLLHLSMWPIYRRDLLEFLLKGTQLWAKLLILYKILFFCSNLKAVIKVLVITALTDTECFHNPINRPWTMIWCVSMNLKILDKCSFTSSQHLASFVLTVSDKTFHNLKTIKVLVNFFKMT